MAKRQKNKTITLSDVGLAAGVSAVTVSRVLRDPALVSPQTRERVERAISKLGFIPNSAAQALASNRTNVIGALIPSVTNNVFSDVLRAMYEAIEGTRYQLQLGNTRYSATEEEKLLRTFLGQRPAGLIVTGIDQSEAARQLLKRAECPVVQIMEMGDDPLDMMIGFSHRDAARTAVEHLIASGYRRVAFLGARMDPRTQRRLQGYREALDAAGHGENKRIVTTPQPSSITLGSQLFADLLARHPDADAVFCNNDDIALGALFEAQRRHISVPRDLGICGFNDLEMMAAACPSLTSVRTHREQMGLRAMQMLIAAIEADEPAPKVVDLGYEVMVRESTKRG